MDTTVLDQGLEAFLGFGARRMALGMSGLVSRFFNGFFINHLGRSPLDYTLSGWFRGGGFWTWLRGGLEADGFALVTEVG